MTHSTPAAPPPQAPRRVLMVLDNPCHPDRRVEKEARTLVAAGHQVTILAWDRTGSLPALETIAGATIIRLPLTSRDNRGFKQLLPMLRFWGVATRQGRHINFDLVHAHDLPSLPVGLTLAALRHRPLVYDAHEIYALMMYGRLPALARKALAILESILIRGAAQVVTVSPRLARHYAPLHPHVSVVGNWYDPIQLDPAEGHALRQRLKIPSDAFALTYVGFLGPERMHTLLIDYAHEHPEVAVVIAGSGAHEREVAQAAASINNLHYLGRVSRPEPIFSAADALFYGLVESNPYSRLISPNNLFQAIAMRKPLIAAGPGEAHQVVRSTGAGIALDEATSAALHQAVIALRNPAQRAAIDRAQVELQRHYNWASAARNLLEAHDSAVRGRHHWLRNGVGCTCE